MIINNQVLIFNNKEIYSLDNNFIDSHQNNWKYIYLIEKKVFLTIQKLIEKIQWNIAQVILRLYQLE